LRTVIDLSGGGFSNARSTLRFAWPTRSITPSFLIAFVMTVPVASASAWLMIAYGDSLTSDPAESSFEWCEERIDLPNICEPRGVGGESTADGVGRLLADLQLGLIPATTDYVVLAWGANDLRQGNWDPVSRIFDPLKSAVTALVEAGHIPLFWTPNPQFELGTPPFVISQFVDDRISQVVAPGILKLASEMNSAPVADHFGAFWSLDETEMALLYSDHVHQNTDGNAYMANTVESAANEHYLLVPEPRGLALSIVSLVTVAVVVFHRGARTGTGMDEEPLRASK
jgi:lysophospholipase L1-like esterase